MPVDLNQIRHALGTLRSGPLCKGAKTFLRSFGYESERTTTIGTVEDFLRQYEVRDTLTDRQQKLFESWTSVEIVFQYTAEEFSNTIEAVSGLQFNPSHIKSLLFVAVDLNRADHNRTYFVECVRAVNRLFSMPVILLYRYDKYITVGVVHRRLHRLSPDRDVLERVTLVRDVDTSHPHRAHLEILADLGRIRSDSTITSFDNLLKAWEDKLDIEQLNQRFYRDLFDWFTKAVDRCSFPDDNAGDGSNERHVIRLITRLMFVWFLRENGFVPSELFDESYAKDILKAHKRSGTDYYRTVLQNLFFGTLNTERDKRGFVTAGNATSSEPGSYRYYSLIAKPEVLISSLQNVPFVNGGLFDCLDDATDSRDEPNPLDMFGEGSEIPSRVGLHVPSSIFFDEHDGLFPVLRRYKFTVEENTPLDCEVALDPELLGRVFENLLAAYDPATKDHARRATGSYYTPRAVVEYMSTETIAMALAAKLDDQCSEIAWVTSLRRLVDESRDIDGELEFSLHQRELIVRAVAELTILDPAVGSGAFLMNMLHTLTVVLRRVDPHGTLWLAIHRSRGPVGSTQGKMIDNQSMCHGTLADVGPGDGYADDLDYYRKLYLIQNSLFGVDILPTACQIAKLRFFISLAIEQTSGSGPNADGFVPLPNLETRIIAADTLVYKRGQQVLGSLEKSQLDQELRDNRKTHFNAITNEQKLRCRRVDEQLRNRLASVMRDIGVSDEFADRLATWNPYDSNGCASWFEPDYMFGQELFDVVIGNPPYIQLQKDGGRLRRRYQGEHYHTFASTGDIYQLFFERGVSLLTEDGFLAFITSNSWLKAKYGKLTREYLSTNHTPLQLIEMGKDVFSNTIVDTSILLLRKGQGQVRERVRAVDLDGTSREVFPPRGDRWGSLRVGGRGPWLIVSHQERQIMERMESVGRPLREWDISIYYGIKTGCNDAFVLDQAARDRLVAEDPASAAVLKPILRGRDIRRYHAQWNGWWLIDSHNGFDHTKPVNVDLYPAIKRHLTKYWERLVRRQDKGVTPFNLRNCAYHELFKERKLFWMDMSPEGRFAISNHEMYCNDKGYIMTGPHLEYLCGYLNSRLINWYFKKTALTTGMGLTQWKKFVVESIPIIPPCSRHAARIIQLVNDRSNSRYSLSSAKAASSDTEIERLVWDSYDLPTSASKSLKSLL